MIELCIFCLIDMHIDMKWMRLLQRMVCVHLGILHCLVLLFFCLVFFLLLLYYIQKYLRILCLLLLDLLWSKCYFRFLVVLVLRLNLFLHLQGLDFHFLRIVYQILVFLIHINPLSFSTFFFQDRSQIHKNPCILMNDKIQ